MKACTVQGIGCELQVRVTMGRPSEWPFALLPPSLGARPSDSVRVHVACSRHLVPIGWPYRTPTPFPSARGPFAPQSVQVISQPGNQWGVGVEVTNSSHFCFFRRGGGGGLSVHDRHVLLSCYPAAITSETGAWEGRIASERRWTTGLQRTGAHQRFQNYGHNPSQVCAPLRTAMSRLVRRRSGTAAS